MSEKIRESNNKLWSDKQNHSLKFWKTATSELEKTCHSVLNILKTNNDLTNYLLYQRQYSNFKNMRLILSEVVVRAVESNQLDYMEKVVIHAIRQLNSMILMKQPLTKRINKLKKSVSQEYTQAVQAIASCMSELYKKLGKIDEYLSHIPKSKMKDQKETFKNLMLLDVMAKNLNNLLEITIKGKEDNLEDVPNMVMVSVSQIMYYIKDAYASDAEPLMKQIYAKRKKPPRRLVSSMSTSRYSGFQSIPKIVRITNAIRGNQIVGDHETLGRMTRNVWANSHENEANATSYHKEKLQNKFISRNEQNTMYPPAVEEIINENYMRNRDKLTKIKKIIMSSPKEDEKLPSQEPMSIPYGWIHPSDDQIEEYISKSGGCPTKLFCTKNHAWQRFTVEELVQLFPVDTQHLRFPPNTSNTTIYKTETPKINQQNNSVVKRIDQDLLQGLLWQWHEDSDSSSTISFRFHFEMTDLERRDKWFRGFRRLLHLDPITMNSLKTEIMRARKSKSDKDLKKLQGSQTKNSECKISKERKEMELELFPPNFIDTSNLNQKYDKMVQFKIFCKFRSVDGIMSASCVFTNSKE